MRRAIIYTRASTAGQMASLEVQAHMAREFCSRFGYEVVSLHAEIASGKDNDRPIYLACIQEALKTDCVLLATKIDRLARRISAIGNLIDCGVDLRVVSIGDQPVSKLVLAVFSAMAEQERDFIASRTKAALAHLRSKGVQLGNPRLHEARAKAVASNKASAAAFRATMAPVIQELQESGLTTLKQIADCLNLRGYTARRGGQFYPSTIRGLLAA